MQRTIRTPRLVILAALCGALLARTPSRAADPAAVGQWSAPFEIHVIGTHAVLLHTGDVLLFSYPAPGDHGSDVWLWSPAQGSRRVSTVRSRDMFCAGHSVLPDGRAFVTGGTMWGARRFDGAHETDLFDPARFNWTPGPTMEYARWYPTNLTLDDGDVLILSGTDAYGQLVSAVERYSVSSGEITRLPASADKLVDEYPRMHLLPSGKVLLAGQEAETFLLDPAAAQWTSTGSMTFGDRYSGTSVLLPGLQKVLALGGNQDDPEAPTLAQGPPTATAEIIDFSQPQPAWRPTSPMGIARQHANAVLLPDGTVLVVGGGQKGLYGRAVHQAELFDPSTETWRPLASQAGSRQYHSTALLLPDGRVLSAGQDQGRWKTTGEVYSPPYLFRGARPRIAAAPSAIGYGGSFVVGTPDAATVAKVVLLRAGSVTHSVNFEQRSVALDFSVGTDELAVQGPAGGTIAPPGWYMLFLVDGNGVPSMAAWVRIG